MVAGRKSPLNKRFIRDLRSDIGKYAVIFLLLMLSIGFSSGYIVAGDSMVSAYNESFEKYNIEDGHFETKDALSRSARRAIEKLDADIYEIYYTEQDVPGHGTLRIFADRKEVDKVCMMSGKNASKGSEIAIDRMYAVNNEFGVGDTITVGGRDYTISGLVALSDYSTMFRDNDDMMFDASLFGTAVVTEEAFGEFDNLHYCYAWKYRNPDPAMTEKELSDEFMEGLYKVTALEDYVPRYQNHAITFTGDDLAGDRAMMEIFLYIITVIIAFVYAITTKDTIEKESTVIGTLRATGYTKNELIRHYLTMPLIVTLISALIGNILGYTFFKDICAGLYYNSYSLTTYVTLWSAEAFLRTTFIPLILMGSVTYLVLRTNLSRSPLAFMRREKSGRRKKTAVPLSSSIPFISRFRARIILQNIPNYVTLFLGIFFASVLLMFGLLLPSVMNRQTKVITEDLICKYQYMLSIPEISMNEENLISSVIELMDYSMSVETDTEGAEKFSAYALKTIPEGKEISDEITLYGIKPGSAYIHQDIKDGEVYVSSLYQDKYRVKPGDRISLREEYEDRVYEFTVTGIYDYEGALCLFMRDTTLNRMFGLTDDFFAGYFSDREITDIDDRYIGTVIDYDALTKVSRQMMISMGGFMKLMDVFAVALSIILIYLLSKIIIEKNAQSISMTKILGYTDRELGGLYIAATTIMVIISIAASVFMSRAVIEYLWRTIIVVRMSGWITLVFDKTIYLKMVTMIFAAFVVVAALEMRKIKNIPMSDALKNVE